MKKTKELKKEELKKEEELDKDMINDILKMIKMQSSENQEIRKLLIELLENKYN
jgi:hypothetical protein